MSNVQSDVQTIIWSKNLRGGSMLSIRLKRHRSLRFTAKGAFANLSLLAYNALNLVERYNMADTLKGQHTAFLTAGNCMYSDQGRVLLSIIEDTCGWHDTIAGTDNKLMMAEKFGQGKYQELRNNFFRNGRDNLLTELGKWGLGKQDIVPNVNLFSKVWIDEESGGMNYDGSLAEKGVSVTLRAEMDTLLVMSNTHHPMYDGPYQPVDVNIEMLEVQAPATDDLCRMSCEQNQRAFINTENFVNFGV